MNKILLIGISQEELNDLGEQLDSLGIRYEFDEGDKVFVSEDDLGDVIEVLDENFIDYEIR